MRRSKAPSQRGKFVPPIIQSNCVNFPSTEHNKIKTQSTSVSRNTNSVLQIIKEDLKHNALQTTKSLKDEEKSLQKNNEEGVNKLFNVVYGKPNKKKHKTWEGDGILEVSCNSVRLKDSEGKIIGSSSKVKLSQIVDGARLFIGNKEVEILDDAVNCEALISIKRVREEVEENLEEKYIKRNKISVQKESILSCAVGSPLKDKRSPQSDKELLVMPRPDDQHQWEYNINHDAVSDVVVDPSLTKHLRPHQKEGVIFLYRCVTGIRTAQYTGAILADEMGLGKTLQAVTLIWTLLRQGPYGGKPLLRKCLVVVPSSLVTNWHNEFIKWIGSHKISLFVIDKKNKPKDYQFSNAPIMIISYEQFVRNIEDLKNVEFDLIVCDEGHRLKNNNIQAANGLKCLACRQRILLTGTPIQNDLQEYYTLIDFVNPGILATMSEFRKKFANAIVASRDPAASVEIVNEGKEKAEELNRFTNKFILRRTQENIGSFLPKKTEYVVFCASSNLQKKLYTSVTKLWLDRVGNSDDVNHLSAITMLKKICNHPLLVQPNRLEQQLDVFSNIFDQVMSKYNFQESDSGKLSIVLSIMKKLNGTGERIVFVSNYTQTLDLFANICDQYGYKYMKFDGSTTLAKRTEIVDKFNLVNSDVYILLLSSKAGGVGLNLIGGSRLILYDSDWNPAVDLQAMARIWREGQKKNVFIYRLLTSGSIEEKIFQRQLSKTGLSESIEKPKSKTCVKLSKEEIMDLFDFTGDDKCLTHEILKCPCCCDGRIPGRTEEEEQRRLVLGGNCQQARDCELSLSTGTFSVKNLRMNELYHWEHHATPLQWHQLNEMSVQDSKEMINFIFRNRTN